ncbi:hypothetical protein I3U70_26375 [Mycobacteroides abscessus subsp. abscessus]|nr:hypothetical protein [Mycobacteroides abscessus subsp. abscessus]
MMPDIPKPVDDPFGLVGASWPVESESAYHGAKVAADDSSTSASTQSRSASDAESKMVDEHGKTADSVSDGYAFAATELSEQSIRYNTISAWMTDAEGKVGGAKKHIASLVRTGTQDIRDALTSELKGTPVTPSSNDLISQYRGEIAQLASKLDTDLDSIGHSLHGDRGASRTPSYTSVSTAPTPEHADPHVSAASYTGAPGAPAPEPHQLPSMPRVTTTPTAESPSAPGTPTAPSAPVNPTLSNLISGSGPSGTPSSPSTSSKPAGTTSAPTTQQQPHQPTEQHQAAKSPALPRIPSIPLPGLPAAAESISTTITSATGSQLPTAAPTTPAAQAPASTGITPGVSGAAPVTPTSPTGLAPIGGLTPTPVTQTAPAPQGTPGTPNPGVQAPSAPQQAPAPRGPVVDAAWIQRNYGLAPGIDLPKSENTVASALFITDLSESEAHLHRVLATLRHQFEQAGWSQPLAVATIRRGFETRTVYVTADGLSIHPSGVRLPSGVNPLDEMPSTPSSHDLDGSLMVTDKLRSLIPREWTVEQVLSTVSGGEGSQSAEEYQELVESGELLECTAARGRDDVGVDEALRMFARAALGSGGCGELGAESARLRAARWVGVQPQGYLDVLGRWYLADAAEAMSRGSWGEAVYSAEKYMFIRSAENKAA